MLPLSLLVAGWLFAACAEEGLADDDTTAADDDVGDDDAGDDDMWADDDDDADDDDTADDDDATAGEPCTAMFGPPGGEVYLQGTCEQDPGSCEGGHHPQEIGGTCVSGLTCCIHADQCEDALLGTCVVSQDDCDSELPPGAPDFPEIGCPQSAPVCCLPEPPR